MAVDARFSKNGSSPPPPSPSLASPMPSSPTSPPYRLRLRPRRPQSAPSAATATATATTSTRLISTTSAPPTPTPIASMIPTPSPYGRLSLSVQMAPGASVHPVDMYFHRSWEATPVLHFRDGVVKRLPSSFTRHADPWVRLEAPVRMFNGEESDHDYDYDSVYQGDDDDGEYSDDGQSSSHDSDTMANPTSTPQSQSSTSRISNIVNTTTDILWIALLMATFISPWLLLPASIPLPIHYPISDANIAINSLPGEAVNTSDWSWGVAVLAPRALYWQHTCVDETFEAGQLWDRELWSDRANDEGEDLPGGAERADVCAMVGAHKKLAAGSHEIYMSLMELECLEAKGQMRDLVSTLVSLLPVVGQDKDKDKDKNDDEYHSNNNNNNNNKAKEETDKDIIALYLDSLNEFYVYYQSYMDRVPDHGDSYSYGHAGRHKRRNPRAYKWQRGSRQFKHTVAEGMTHALTSLDDMTASIEGLEDHAGTLESFVSRFPCAEGEVAHTCFDQSEIRAATEMCARMTSIRTALGGYRDRVEAALQQMRALHAGLTLVARLQGIRGSVPRVEGAGSAELEELDIWALVSMWTGGSSQEETGEQRWTQQARALAMTAWERLLPWNMRPNTHFQLPSVRAQKVLFNDSARAVARAWGWEGRWDIYKGCLWC